MSPSISPEFFFLVVVMGWGLFAPIKLRYIILNVEHVAAVWFNEDKNELQWYLGIASETANANDPLDKILISYLYRSGQSSSIWKLGHSI